MDTKELESKILEHFDIVYEPISRCYEKEIDEENHMVKFIDGKYYNKSLAPSLVKKPIKKPCDDCGELVINPSSRIKIKDKKCTRRCNNCSAVF